MYFIQKEGESWRQETSNYKCDKCDSVVEIALRRRPFCWRSDEIAGGEYAGCFQEACSCSEEFRRHESQVGSVAHPMTVEHHIAWIEVINGDYVNRYHLADCPAEAVLILPRNWHDRPGDTAICMDSG